MPTTIVREFERTAAPDGTVSLEPGLIEVAGRSRTPAAAEGWLGLSGAARHLGVVATVVHAGFRVGLVPTYRTATSRRPWCRAEDVDRLRVRGVVMERSNGPGGTRPTLVTELYLPGEEPSGSPAR